MRKKTIKYYFFNNQIKNPSMQYLFCFSKKALKQNKQEVKLKKLFIKLKKYKTKKNIESITYFTNFKNKIMYNIKLNQWPKNNQKVIILFFKSYFVKKYILTFFKKINKYKKKLIFLWFLFKNKFYKELYNYLNNFLKIGYLSSHYVHILSRKNLMYQARLKYRSKHVKLNYFNYYVYNFTKFIYLYLYSLNTKLYFFTTNSIHKNIWLNDEFNICTSLWGYTINNVQNSVVVNWFNRSKIITLDSLNTYQFNNKILCDIYKNLDIINNFFYENDKKKHNDLFNILLQKLQHDTINYICAAKFFIQNINTLQKINYNIYLISLYQHLYLYKIIK